MHANLRRYPRIGVPREEIEAPVRDELLPELRADPGFRGYRAFWAEDGAAVSVFGDADAALG